MKKLLLLLLAINYFIGCKREIVTVIEEPPRLFINSLFAINGNGSVTLGWDTVRYGTPSELVVYRGSTAEFVPSSSTYYRSLPAAASRFVDSLVANGGYYYYRIVPVEIQSSGQRLNGTPTNVAIGRPYDYSTIKAIQYSNHIQPIFTSGCAVHGCHTTSNGGGSGAGGLSLDSWEHLFEGGKDGAVVIPYKSSKSDLIFHTNFDTLIAPVSEPHMPLEGFDLPRSQIQTLIWWIDGGAPNDQGRVAFATNPQGKILVVNASEDLLAVIDVEKNLVFHYIAAGRPIIDSTTTPDAPHHIRVDRRGIYLYATLINARELWKFSARTYEFLGKVTIPSQAGRVAQPADIVLSVTGDTAFVTDFNSSPGRVVMVDTRTMQVIRTVTLYDPISPFTPTLPHGALLSMDRTKLFITNSGTGNVSMIRLADMSQTLITLDTTGNSRTTNTSPYLCDITPDGRYLFVTDYKAAAQNIYVIDFRQDSTKAWKVIPIGGRSVHVAVTPNGRYAFVCNFSLNSVQVIDTADFSVTPIPISNFGRQPHGVIFTPDGSTAYVSTENLNDPNPPHHPTAGVGGVSYVVVIDVATKSVVKRIEVGAWGQGIAYSP